MVVPPGTTIFNPESTVFTPVVVIPEMVPEAAKLHPAGGAVGVKAPVTVPPKEVVLEYKATVFALFVVVVHCPTSVICMGEVDVF
jgi:hypothetical protein